MRQIYLACRRFYTKLQDFKVSFRIKTGLYKWAEIKHMSEEGKKICQFQAESIERLEMIKTYGFIESGNYTIKYPEIDLWLFRDSTVFHSSDFVITAKGNAIWPKYFFYNYSKNITRDKFLVKEENGRICYKTPQEVIKLDAAFSMIGVFSHIWAHAIVEYFPKLSMLEAAIKDSKSRITVLIPEYRDPQLKQIMMGQLSKYDVDVMVISPGEAVHARSLYFIERPTRFTDHEAEITPADQAIPESVVNVIKRELVNPLIENAVANSKYKKIFLVRRGGIGKGILNGDEIERYFESLGFILLEPHKVSLEEKINIFQSAEFIVGPFGSAFTNLFFCKPGTKVLMFSNYQRLFENYFSVAQQYFGVKEMYVTGFDDKKTQNMSHCSFYLPLGKVKDAYNQLLNE